MVTRQDKLKGNFFVKPIFSQPQFEDSAQKEKNKMPEVEIVFRARWKKIEARRFTRRRQRRRRHRGQRSRRHRRQRRQRRQRRHRRHRRHRSKTRRL